MMHVNIHTRSEHYEENGYRHNLDSLIISHTFLCFISYVKMGAELKVLIKAHLPWHRTFRVRIEVCKMLGYGEKLESLHISHEPVELSHISVDFVCDAIRRLIQARFH